jgi:mono/diheme cytochrome c family protein
MLAMLFGASIALYLLRPNLGPPPAEIADDPFLVEGRAVYFSRCISCHGPAGKGDGPTAKILSGPPPRDLTASEWKHGDDPERVLSVVSQGVRDTAMPGWKGILTDAQVREVTGFVYYLGKRNVPDALRTP